ncbi:Hypothetical predicted protein [Octopus vulgaris]|uniref:Uncharacterized protein n=1 Tax=Octopus vulgaris TaxID=6645 RepID=A0AA36BK81_OCTVU|nr:Hypothetical predicted protein [Octopus vulgaris]
MVSFHNLEEKDSMQLLAMGVDDLLNISYPWSDASRKEWLVTSLQEYIVKYGAVLTMGCGVVVAAAVVVVKMEWLGEDRVA